MARGLRDCSILVSRNPAPIIRRSCCGAKRSAAVLPGQVLTDGTVVSLPASPSLTSSATFAFADLIAVAPRGVDHGAAIYLYSGGSVTPVVKSGQQANATGGTFATALGQGIEHPSINKNRDVALLAAIQSGTAEHGIFLYSGGSVSKVALKGDPAPGITGSFHFFPEISLNDTKSVAFLGTVDTGSTDSQKRFANGLFLSSAATVSAIAVKGQNSPGTIGGQFSAITSAKLNNTGTVAFAARLSGGSASEGIFLAR